MKISRPLVALAATVLALTGCSSDPEKKPDTLPEISLPLIDANGLTGDELNLADVRGPAVLNVWASWCGPCIEEIPMIKEFAAAHPEVEVIGINHTDRSLEAAQTFIADQGIKYRNVFDLTGEINNRGAIPRLRGMPMWIFVNANGKVTQTQAIPMHSAEQIADVTDNALPGVLKDIA